MKMFDVCALGELLIDFTENGISEQGNPILEANPGGAPCNVLAMLSKLGYSTAFIGKIGDDIFGRQLKKAVADLEIDTSGLVIDANVNTTLAFVHTLEGGEREFSFYRNPGADMMLNKDEINRTLIEKCKIFHFGSLSMTSECCETATKEAVKLAKNSGKLVSFDPNLRENLWDSLDAAKTKIKYGISCCDILKISDNELVWITGENDYNKAAEMIKKEYDIPFLFVSLGSSGSMAYSNKGYAYADIVDADTIEKTGAGDTFCGCVLGKILEYGPKDFSSGELKDILMFANAAAAIVTGRKGALKVMPGLEEIKRLLVE